MSLPFEKDLKHFYFSAADLSIYLPVGRNPSKLSDQIPFHGPSSFCQGNIALLRITKLAGWNILGNSHMTSSSGCKSYMI